MASFEPAFDTSNRMVVGINPYAGTRYVQYYNNPTSLNPSNPSDPTFAVPSGQLEDFYGWPVESTFDSSNNLYVYDANRGRVNIYNTPFGATARYHSGDTVQAEAYTSQSGTQLQTNGTTVGNFDAGDSLCYDGVDFTGITNLAMTLASANSGGVFSVRIDSPTGTELGRTTVQSTGGWSTWQVKNVSVSQTSGIHTLCLHGESGSGITNLDSFQLGASGGLPDLVVTAVNWSPANIAAGQPATFSATVKNQGSGATPAGVIIGVSFSVDGTQVNWSDTDTTSLAAGASVTLTANSGPSGSATWTTTAGLHSVQAWVDDVNRMAESNESNNQLSVSLPIGIDLTVTSVTWSPTSPHSGNAVLFSATVKNKGTVATPAGVIVGVRFDVDGNAVSWSDTDTTSLAPGASVTLTANSGPSGNANWNATSGTHTVQGWVDDVNRMTDVDRSNNKLLTSLSVP
jgi:hypothetical protein